MSSWELRWHLRMCLYSLCSFGSICSMNSWEEKCVCMWVCMWVCVGGQVTVTITTTHECLRKIWYLIDSTVEFLHDNCLEVAHGRALQQRSCKIKKHISSYFHVTSSMSNNLFLHLNNRVDCPCTFGYYPQPVLKNSPIGLTSTLHYNCFLLLFVLYI